MEYNEQYLIEQCLGGDYDKFGLIYDRYIRKIYDFVYFKTHHRQTAEDLTSQTFFKALRNLKEYDVNKGKFSSWLYQIARNAVIDHYRTQKKDLNIEDVWDLKSNEDISQNSANLEKLRAVRVCLEKLSAKQREIVLLRIWQDLPYREIAEIVGKSEQNCKVIFSRTMASLRGEALLAFLLLLPFQS